MQRYYFFSYRFKARRQNLLITYPALISITCLCVIEILRAVELQNGVNRHMAYMSVLVGTSEYLVIWINTGSPLQPMEIEQNMLSSELFLSFWACDVSRS